MIDHMAGDVSVVVFSDSYADFAHLNADRCEYLEGVGFAKVMSLGGLGTGRKRRSHPGQLLIEQMSGATGDPPNAGRRRRFLLVALSDWPDAASGSGSVETIEIPV